MKTQIKHRFTEAVLHEGDYVSILEAVSGAIKAGANLSGANLSGANLSRVNLYGANLSDADLSRVNLYGANLSGANLSGVNLSDADLYVIVKLKIPAADLSGANSTMRTSPV